MLVLQGLPQQHPEQLLLIRKLEQSSQQLHRFSVEGKHFRTDIGFSAVCLGNTLGSLDEVGYLDLRLLIVLLEKVLTLHPPQIAIGGDGQRELSLLLIQGDLKLEVFQLGILAAHVCDYVLGGEVDRLDRIPFAVVEVNFYIVQTDVGSLLNFIVALEVSLQVIFRSTHSDLGGVFQHQGVLGTDIEEERGSLEGSAVEVGLDMGVNEGGDARELHLKQIIARLISISLNQF